MKVVLCGAGEVDRGGAEAVLAALPVWGRMQVVEALTGLPDPCIRKLVNDGLVRARKSGPEKRAACVFRVADVLEWLDKDAAREKAIERCHVDRVVFARMRGDA